MVGKGPLVSLSNLRICALPTLCSTCPELWEMLLWQPVAGPSSFMLFSNFISCHSPLCPLDSSLVASLVWLFSFHSLKNPNSFLPQDFACAVPFAWNSLPLDLSWGTRYSSLIVTSQRCFAFQHALISCFILPISEIFV